jgi:hypothetical protein
VGNAVVGMAVKITRDKEQEEEREMGKVLRQRCRLFRIEGRFAVAIAARQRAGACGLSRKHLEASDLRPSQEGVGASKQGV